MAFRKVLVIALLAGAASASAASVTIFGTSSARACYEAAESTRIPSPSEISICDLALRSEPLGSEEIVATHVNRGILRLRRGDVDGALRDFDRAIQLDPGEPESYLNKGSAMVRQERPGEAVRLFTEALQRQTRRPAVAHYGRAVAHEALGNVRDAYRDYRRASTLDPEWEDPQAELRRFRVVSP